jgi:hypothetical protein
MRSEPGRRPVGRTRILAAAGAIVVAVGAATVAVLVGSPTPRVSPGPASSATPDPDPGPMEPTRCTTSVSAPDSIQAAIDANPAGATYCLSGTFRVSTTIRPKSGDRFVGPATIVGAGADIGFQTRSGAGATDVTFVNLDVSGFPLQAIGCWVGTEVIGGRYHHNGRNAIGCGLEGGDVLIDGVEVDHNGSEAYLGCCSAGMKFAQGHGIVVRDSFIHDNIGNGVWCDVQCGDYTVVGNRIIHNSRKGIHYEKSGGSDFQAITFVGTAYIARNLIQDNGWEGRQYADAGIAAVSSKNVLIEDNVFGGNAFGNGIKIIQDDRLTGDTHGWIVSNIVIGSNQMNGEEVQGCELDAVACL